jgi:acyl-CoA thioesterase
MTLLHTTPPPGFEAASSVPNQDAMWALFRGDRFAASIGAELTGWGAGWSRVAWTPREEHVNFAGSTHGGALFTLGDAAFAVGCNAWGRASVALSVDVHFLKAVKLGTGLVATCTERTRSRRTGSYGIEVVTAEDPARVVASLHAMAFRTEIWHLGEDAWPDAWRSLA